MKNADLVLSRRGSLVFWGAVQNTEQADPPARTDRIGRRLLHVALAIREPQSVVPLNFQLKPDPLQREVGFAAARVGMFIETTSDLGVATKLITDEGLKRLFVQRL
jgi:hypothetical protein